MRVTLHGANPTEVLQDVELEFMDVIILVHMLLGFALTGGLKEVMHEQTEPGICLVSNRKIDLEAPLADADDAMEFDELYFYTFDTSGDTWKANRLVKLLEAYNYCVPDLASTQWLTFQADRLRQARRA